LVVRGFEVRNHRMAIAYLGERGAAPSSTSHTRIEENLFENIGQQRADVKPAFAAITLVNSRSNQISRNTFRNITNIDDCGGLHAIYLASGSSDNRVEDNVFDGGCGDTIKTRDRSNGNLIRGNTFRNQTGLALYVDSFCDRRKVAACAKGAQECASWGNRFEGNKIDAAAQRSIKTPTRTAGAGNIPSCPAPKPGTARISVAP
jgi:nitrous oxidase accessory protein NosD